MMQSSFSAGTEELSKKKNAYCEWFAEKSGLFCILGYR